MFLSFVPLMAGGAASNSQAVRGPGVRELSEGVLSQDILLQETEALN